MTFFKICIPDKYIFITISNKQERNILTPAVHGNILTVNLIIQGKLSIYGQTGNSDYVIKCSTSKILKAYTCIKDMLLLNPIMFIDIIIKICFHQIKYLLVISLSTSHLKSACSLHVVIIDRN